MTGIEPKIITETSDWIVVDKPSRWLTIAGRPGSAGERPVLLDWLKARYGDVWVVHRLDVETSGLLLFARSAEAHRRASLWFEKHQIKKSYDCLAAGVPKLPVFRIDRPIEGAPSVSQIEVRERCREGFLARVRIVTGRRHQIRIHLSGAGHPLWGDPTYGGAREVGLVGQPLSVDRVALHAASLELPTGERFEAPWPEDFSGWVAALRERGAGV